MITRRIDVRAHFGAFAALAWILMICAPGAARADVSYSYGELTCEGDRALLRFATAFDADLPVYPRLPAAIDEFHAAAEQRNTCTLSGGRRVKFKIGDLQRRPYGQCGGALNSFASLWVDGRKVLSRQRVLSACFSSGFADIILLEGDTLTLCRSETAVATLMDLGHDGGAGCRDASDMVANAEVDAVEYPAAAAPLPLGSITIPFAEDEPFCAAFVTREPAEAGPPWALSQASAMDSFDRQHPAPGTKDYPRSDRLWAPSAQTYFRLPADAAPVTYHQLVLGQTDAHDHEPGATGYFDFDNDGRKDLVFRVSGTNGYFDGTVFKVALSAAPEPLASEIIRMLSRNTAHTPRWAGGLVDLEAAGNYTGPFPGVAPDYRDRYTYQVAFRYKGETLVFATPVTRSLRPTAIVYRPLAGGRTAPVCVFQRVEENY